MRSSMYTPIHITYTCQFYNISLSSHHFIYNHYPCPSKFQIYENTWYMHDTYIKVFPLQCRAFYNFELFQSHIPSLRYLQYCTFFTTFFHTPLIDHGILPSHFHAYCCQSTLVNIVYRCQIPSFVIIWACLVPRYYPCPCVSHIYVGSWYAHDRHINVFPLQCRVLYKFELFQSHVPSLRYVLFCPIFTTFFHAPLIDHGILPSHFHTYWCQNTFVNIMYRCQIPSFVNIWACLIPWYYPCPRVSQIHVSSWYTHDTHIIILAIRCRSLCKYVLIFHYVPSLRYILSAQFLQLFVVGQLGHSNIHVKLKLTQDTIVYIV